MKIPLIALFLCLTPIVARSAGFIVDHTSTNLSVIPDTWITKAKADLHIIYKHTSHGSQIISGMKALKNYPDYGGKYDWTDSSQGDGSMLSLDDRAFTSPSPDLSQGDGDSDNDGIADWAEHTYSILDNPDYYHVNVFLWSWCNIAGHNIPRYLHSMEWLIGMFGKGGSHARAAEHPVQFVFITGHANSGGENDSSDEQNRLIREHCRTHDRILFDFADMENYDPDNNYFLDKRVTDALYYDKNGSHDANWATEYLARHTGDELDRLTTGRGVNNYDGIDSCAHSPGSGETSDARLNCALKGRAAWYLFARLEGWNPDNGGGTGGGGTTGGSSTGINMVPVTALLLR